MTTISKGTLIFIVFITIICSVLIHFSFQFLTPSEKNKIVHFDNEIVFSKFNLSKELSDKGMQYLNSQKRKVDSLVAILQNSEDNKDTQQLFIAENNKLQKMSEDISSQANTQIWARINQYAQDFGEAQDYDIILGTTGNGNVMYAKKSVDVTEDFLVFANNKYEGGE